MKKSVHSDEAMKDLGRQYGGLLVGGEVIELIGDVGAGKTTFTKGVARGLGITEPIQSPTFTISRVYAARDDLELRHYDFYRLGEAGIMQEELIESFETTGVVTVIEWADVVDGVLPSDRLQIRITATAEDSRDVEVVALGPRSQKLEDRLP